MEDTILQRVEQLTEQVKLLELTCIKLEAERDAHMEVIRQLFEIKVSHGHSEEKES